MITADDERRFYDQQYTQFLSLPDHSLRISRAILERDLADPRHPIYERRRLYKRTLELLLGLAPAGKRVLEYGCGTGDWGLLLATEGAEATLLDLSPVAIEVVQKRAAASGVQVRGVARDAADLSCFSTGEFDLIYANAALHHTLKYDGARDELVRVLKPGGYLVLSETFGNNPLINAARRIGWKLRGQADEQGEEILFGASELDLLRAAFSQVTVEPMYVLGMVKRLFRGRFANPLVRGLLGGIQIVDWPIERMLPNYCGEVLVVARK
ncbi:MAG: methyltransferase domain-containing protein [Bryobacteraceae bacterium]